MLLAYDLVQFIFLDFRDFICNYVLGIGQCRSMYWGFYI